MADALNPRRVTARIESAADVAARLPSFSGVVAIPYLAGWATRQFNELATRVQGAIVRAVTSRDLRKRDLSSVLQTRIDDAKNSPSSRAVRAGMVLEVCRKWCIERRYDPDALEVLSEAPDATLDGSIVSAVLDASKHVGEMGRSRVVGALAQRLLQRSSALTFTDGVSRVLAAAKDLPWESPAHEYIARACVALERDLFYDASEAERSKFEHFIKGALTDLVNGYAEHPRVAVLQHVARGTDRSELLQKIANRAQAALAIDPRLTYRLVEALALNPATPVEVLQPFARADFWTKGEPERQALDALLTRSMGHVVKLRQSNDVALTP